MEFGARRWGRHPFERVVRGGRTRKPVVVVGLVLASALLATAWSSANGQGGGGAPGPRAEARAEEPSEPIVITEGGTYSGRWESGDPDVPAVRIRTSEPVVIEDAFIRARGDLIRADHGFFSDVVVRHVRGEGLPPQEAGRSPGRFLAIDTYARVTVEDSILEGTAGIYLYESVEGATVKIVRNRARNIDGRRSNGHGAHDGVDYVQFVQLNRGRGLRDSEIAWNEVVNESGRSRVEDVISLFDTFGREGDPVRAHDNLIHGAFPAEANRDTFSGGGIMLGDGGGGYLHAHDNTVIATSNYGIAIAGGHDNVIRDNIVISCGRLADGSIVASQNVGIYIWNQEPSRRFDDNGGGGNAVAWQGAEARNDWWVPDAATWDDNVALYPGRPVPCEAEQEAAARWRSERDRMLADGAR